MYCEGCFSDVRGPFRTKDPPQNSKIVRTRTVHTSVKNIFKTSQKITSFNFIFTVEDTESKYHIKKNSCTQYTNNTNILKHKRHVWGNREKTSTNNISNFVFYKNL